MVSRMYWRPFFGLPRDAVAFLTPRWCRARTPSFSPKSPSHLPLIDDSSSKLRRSKAEIILAASDGGQTLMPPWWTACSKTSVGLLSSRRRIRIIGGPPVGNRLLNYKGVVKGNFQPGRRFLRVKKHHLPPSLHQVVEVVPLPKERAGVEHLVPGLDAAVLAEVVARNRQPQ